MSPHGRSSLLLILLLAIGTVGIAAFVVLGRTMQSPFLATRALRERAAPAARPAGTANGLGTLRLRVVESTGSPVAGASVHIANATTSPPVTLLLASDNNGVATADALPAADGYAILIAKAGYAREQTYAPSAEYPRPFQPPLTVRAGATTSATFTIDRLGALAITFLHDRTRQPFRELTTFTLAGTQGVAAMPNPQPPPDELIVRRAAPQSFTTSAGAITIGELPYDAYWLTTAIPGYDLATSDPPLPATLTPGAAMPITVTIAPHAEHALHVLVRGTDGRLLGNAAITVTDAARAVIRGKTERNGQFFFTPVAAGSATVRVVCGAARTVERTVDIRGRTTAAFDCAA